MEYALITGASRGIGKATAIALAKAGYPVLLNYLSNKAAAEEVLQMIENEGGKAELLPFDISDKKQIEIALDGWKSAHSNDFISVLVNNAGIREDALMVFMEENQWTNVLNTNLYSFFYVTKAVLQTMVTKRKGRIINVVSLSGLKGLPGQVNYSAAKAGIIGATKALAQEVAARKITVNAVAPGFIATDMTKDLDIDNLKKQIPANRFGTAEEVAALITFLASESASYITGEVISINGGLYT
ncbi:MAG: 3-oxoacyl-ACP reductase FabG [Bacteroidales bacterium]|jgi:3-oxoacyl-[acyl-carrier protein] reductase|nr:3-oxoacyl-ACP reductase FabG [Bacteroidales bacterium]